jgi:arginine utilization protein RocB
MLAISGSLVPNGDFVQARFAGEIMKSSGAGDLGELKVGWLLTGKDVHVDVDLSGSSQEVTAATRPQDLEAMLA